MDNTFYFKIAKDDMSGLCNQLYHLSGCIEYCVNNNINKLVIGKFLKEVKTDKTCPISEILDIPKFNSFLKKYKIEVIDGWELFESNKNLFKTSPIPYMGQSKNAIFFIEILTNIPFLEKYKDISKNQVKHNHLNVIHLRLENDAVECFSKELNIDPYVYKYINEYRYIKCIEKHIDKNTMIYVLTSDENNRVIQFLKENNYKFMTTQKVFQDRDVNAIIDLLIGCYCTKTFIGSFDSSFSYTIMSKLCNKHNGIESYLIDCNMYINRYRMYNDNTYNMYNDNIVYKENMI